MAQAPQGGHSQTLTPINAALQQLQNPDTAPQLPGQAGQAGTDSLLLWAQHLAMTPHQGAPSRMLTELVPCMDPIPSPFEIPTPSPSPPLCISICIQSPSYPRPWPLPLTKVDEHVLHGHLLLHHQVTVCPQAVQDGQNFLRVVQGPLCQSGDRQVSGSVPRASSHPESITLVS